MKIGGFQKTSLLDYPDKISCIVWTMGCNFRCPFCYNKDLVEGKLQNIPEKEIISFLKNRKGLIDAVVFTGGEPLIQKDITSFLEKIKKLGFLVKVDTNGTKPEKIQELLDKKLVDYIAMDVKAPKKKYNNLSGVKTDIKNLEKSIKIIKEKAPDYEFRTTTVPGLLKKEDLVEIGRWLKTSKKYFLQQFKNDVSVFSPKLEKVKLYSDDELEDILQNIKPFFKKCEVRGA